jgi:hypothetical protein
MTYSYRVALDGKTWGVWILLDSEIAYVEAMESAVQASVFYPASAYQFSVEET